MRLLVFIVLLFICSFVQSKTIYLCKSYAGGTFWSSGLCSSQQALIERTFNVPDGMPFDQQVKIAQSQLNSVNALHSSLQTQNSSPSGSCPKLAHERTALDQITEKMTWVPIEQQNANYHRMNQIKSDMARFGCRY